MKKGKTVTFQLQDQHEQELFKYCEQLHNFSGTIKRVLASSDGFKVWQEKEQREKARTVKVFSSQDSGVIKFTL